MDKQKILVVDDNEINRQILHELLCDEYTIIECANGVEALDIVRMNVSSLSLILLDIMMPELDGIGLMNILKKEGATLSVPVIFITAANITESSGLKMGAVDFITKPFDPDIVKLRVNNHIRLKNYRDHLEALIAYDVASSDKAWETTLETLASVAEYRSTDYISKTITLKNLTSLMLDKLKSADDDRFYYSDEETEAIKCAAMTVDIGKIRIPESILLKPGKLTDEEFAVMKGHSEYGALITESFADGNNDLYVEHCKKICKYHHEKWDGTGYPDKLSGTKIPASARIVALLHVYNALTSKRPYRDALSHEEALKVIETERGKYFDPDITDIFLEFHHEFDEARHV